MTSSSTSQPQTPSADPFTTFQLAGLANPQAHKWNLESLHSIAETHIREDLQQSDRDLLQKASKKVSVHYTVGSLLGLGLGVLLTLRTRRARLEAFKAFRAEKPKEIVFESGRREPVPDLTQFVKPTTFGDVVAGLFFSGSGLFIGSQLGLLTGSSSAIKTIDKNQEARQRIMTAFTRFRIDVLKREIEQLEASQGNRRGWTFLNRS